MDLVSHRAVAAIDTGKRLCNVVFLQYFDAFENIPLAQKCIHGSEQGIFDRNLSEQNAIAANRRSIVNINGCILDNGLPLIIKTSTAHHRHQRFVRTQSARRAGHHTCTNGAGIGVHEANTQHHDRIANIGSQRVGRINRIFLVFNYLNAVSAEISSIFKRKNSCCYFRFGCYSYSLAAILFHF